LSTGEDNKNSFENELFPFMASPEIVLKANLAFLESR